MIAKRALVASSSEFADLFKEVCCEYDPSVVVKSIPGGRLRLQFIGGELVDFYGDTVLTSESYMAQIHGQEYNFIVIDGLWDTKIAELRNMLRLCLRQPLGCGWLGLDASARDYRCPKKVLRFYLDTLMSELSIEQ